jgi:hypothetical protein
MLTLQRFAMLASSLRRRSGMVISAKNVALCSRPIAATRLANLHLVWFSTGTFCLNVWKLLSSSMPQGGSNTTLAWQSLTFSPLSSGFGKSLRWMPLLIGVASMV